MKRPAQLQKEILQLHDAYWNGYMNGDIKGMSQLLDEGYTQVGSAETEVFSNKKDAVKFLRDTIDQVAGKLEMRKRHTRVEALGDLFLVHEQCDVYVLDGKKWIFYSKFRASTWFKETKRGWKIIHQHSSFPDTRAGEGENIATEKISRENQQLREAVKRRTKELEDKNRELEIEAALERVRSRALSMHHSEELSQLVSILFDELVKLDLVLARCIIWILNTDDRSARIWIANIEDRKTPESFRVPPLKHPYYESIIKAWKKKNPKWIYKLGGAEKRSIDRLLLTQTELSRLPRAVKRGIAEKKQVFISGSFQNFGFIEASGPERHTEEQMEILLRFSRVFDQAYTRFLDLQKAEAQARESQIQLALEQVRARSLAMHKSSEIQTVVYSLFERLTGLDIYMDTANIIVFRPNGIEFEMWLANAKGQLYAEPFVLPLKGNKYLNDLRKLSGSKREVLSKIYYKEEKSKIFKDTFANTNLGSLPADRKRFILESPCFNISFTRTRNTGIQIIRYKPISFTASENETLIRFSQVFDQAYTRFLDLQKAEAQAREAQMEAALERIRTRSMGMQRAEDLRGVVKELYVQLKLVGFKMGVAAIQIIDDTTGDMDIWMEGFEDGYELPERYHVPYFNHPGQNEHLRRWKNGEQFAVLELSGKAKESYDNYFFNHTDFAKAPEQTKRFMRDQSRLVTSMAYMKYGAIGWAPSNIDAEQALVLRRVAKVFEQTYTRFLDLQKAEAQAREAEIAASLERVRSRSLAMQKAAELREVAELLRKEMGRLGVEELETSSIYIEGEEDTAECWYAIKDVRGKNTRLVSDEMTLKLNDTWVGRKMWKFSRSKMDRTSIVMRGQHRKEWINYCADRSLVLKDYYGEEIPERTYHLVKFNGGYMGAASPGEISGKSWELLKRTAEVFSFAYSRFKDLQEADARAREVQIELALERVRARALAMRQSEELLDVAKVLREQMGLLGQPELETSAVHLYEEDPDNILSWRAFRLGSDLRSKVSYGSMAIPKNSCEIVREFTRKFYSSENAYTIEISGLRQTAWYKILFKIAPDVAHAMKKSKSTREKRFYHFSKFSGGALLMVSSRHPSRETIELQKRSADVFDLAYRRFKDLKNAEAQTREAQIEAALERVRARTMAMHKSTELPETAAILFNEFEKLGAGTLLQATIGLYHPDKRLIEFHATNPEGGGIRVEKAVSMSMDEPTLLRPITKAWEEHKKSVVVELTGKKLETWLRYRNARMGGNVKSIDTGGRRVITAAFFSKGHLTLSSAERRPAEIVRLLERFAAVFDGTYTRFLDLQKAEAQAREAQIEAALEKIRSRSLAMHRSDELKDVIAVLFEKLSELKVLKGTIAIQLFDRQTKDSFLWVGNSIQEPQMVSLPFNEKMLKEETYLRDGWEAMNKGLEIINKEYTIKQKDRFFDYIFANNDFTIIPETPRQVLKQIQHYVVCLITEKHSALFADSFDAGLFDYDSLNVLRRASRVFEQAYIRFLDLQKAEVQAREAQIEAALERVRARTMAMHKSDELREAGELLWNELTKLGIQSISSGYVLIDEEKKIGWTYAPNPATGNKIGEPLGILHSETKEMREVLAAWKKQQPFSVVEMDEQEMITHQTFIAERSLSPDGKITKWITASQLIALSPIRLFLHNFNFKQGYLLIVGGERLNEAQIELMLRFTGVFQQTYTRFLDLQKAESQAREAQIEASLERVRSKTMAMHNSQDVGETVVSMFNEFVNLGIHTNRCGILIFNDEHVVEVWTARSMQGRPAKLIIGQLELSTHRMLRQVYDAWKEKETFYQYDLLGDDLVAYYTAINNSRFYPTQFNLSALPPEEFHSDFFFTDGAVFSFSGKPLIEEHARIMNRFAGVFGQTYRRYLDLKRAEAQAREAQIEAALERVRAKAMAMKQSTDLLDIVVEMRKEFTRLGHEAHYFWYMNWLPDKYEKAMTSGDGSRIGMVLDLPRGFHGNAAMTAWEANQEPLGIFTFDADSAIDYLNQMASFGQFRQVDPHAPGPDAVKAIGGLTFVMARTKHGEIGYSLPGVVPDPPAEDMKTLTRFAGVFDLAYQRYVDIEKAEASAKAALQQASVDRVRAEIASMRTVQDLDRITPLIWSELTALSIPFVRCGVFIMDDHDKQIHTFLSTPDGKAIAAFHLPFDTAGNLAGAINGWRIHQRYVTHWVDKDFELQADVLVKQGSIANREQYLHAIPKEGIYLHFLPFLQGMLYVGHTEALGDEDLNLVQSVADAFSTAYARYEDFNKLEAAKKEVEKTLSDLKQAQQQLVQSEKMASLGELTAGIAHEIQNPLNFVNNFSEVSNELVREIQEIRRKTQDGKVESEESQLLNDIARNLEKINFHGKRADAIVKSMLQHSRTGSDKKESTDINALCDEYLRLAFHGLRAKDKSFNAKFESSLDPTLRKIDVMPQEIGRVILNLINNAFYAVNERAKSESPASGFQPQVNVSTKALGNKIQIMIRDNGTGIPEKVRDKIFQPFFTTKPTGQGTGLGLSLAYDIVTKAHGGELKVETKEGEGTEFKILLPIQF